MLNIRSEDQIQTMRKPGLLVWKAHQIAAELVRPGVTTREIDAAVEDFFTQVGAVPLFKGYPGPVPFPAVTCISVNEEVVHGIPGDRKLQEGDIISIDTGCRFDGWCGDAAVTHPVGEIDETSQRLLEITKGTLDLAIEQIPKCRRWSDVAKQMEKYVKDAGFSVVEAFVGHGIGRQMHEEPQVPNFAGRYFRASGADFELKPGVVIAVEPMVNVGKERVVLQKDKWTQSTQDQKNSAHFEHTIAILDGRVRVLTAAPEEGEDVPW